MIPSIAVESRRILGTRVDVTNYERATRHILQWAHHARSCYICFGVVSSIMEAHDSPDYRDALERAALVTADGMPLVWLLHSLGIPHATRVYGPDLTLTVLEEAAASGIPVGFYGGTETALRRLQAVAVDRFPALRIAYAESPPFRPLTREEDEQTIRQVRASGVKILFVGLGSPKQDRWMHAHLGRIDAVMLGVGAAFDFLAGTKPQAPRWMQRSGLEWLFRFKTEPKRLWRRYVFHNPRFIILALRQLLQSRLNEHRRPA